MPNGDIPDSDTHHKEHEESDKDTYATPRERAVTKAMAAAIAATNKMLMLMS